MRKVLFSVGINAVEALGSVTRMAAIAEQVRKIAPETAILFRASGMEAEFIRKIGFDTIDGFKPSIFGFKPWQMKLLAMINRKGWDGTTPYLKSMISIIRMKGLHKREFVDRTYKEWEDLILKFQPEVIVSEFDFIAPIAAKKAGIPNFTTIQTPGLAGSFSELFYKGPKTDGGMHRSYNSLLKRLGYPCIHDIRECFLGLGISGRIIPSIPEMEDIPDHPNNHFVGNLIMESGKEFVWNADKKRPLVYVYLSVGGQIKPERLEKVMLEAFENSDFDAVVSTAGNPYFDKKGDYRKGNVQFLKFVSSAAILESADIAIHHGGQNSTLQCMAAKVPALIFPGLHFERHYNAKKAALLGCAYNLPNDRFTSEDILSLCREVRQKYQFQENLSKYSRKIYETGGSKKAAEIILALDKENSTAINL